MRTVSIILGGFVLLGIFLAAARFLGDGGVRPMLIAAQFFIPVWLAAAVFNMWMGVARAGYSVAEETPIMLLIFALPAACAGLAWWKFS
jgi:hypothetical protein